MSTNSQIDKHMFYTLNSLLSQQNRDGVFDLAYIREKFNNSIIVDTHRKSLYALNHEFGYVSLYVNPDDQNSYSDISAYSTLTYNIFPYTDASGNSYLLKVQFENGLFSLEATPGFYFNVSKYTLTPNTYLKNTNEEIIIECGVSSSISRVDFSEINNVTPPYDTYLRRDGEATYNCTFDYAPYFIDFENNVSLYSETEKDTTMTLKMVDKYGVSDESSIPVKYRKTYKIYKTPTYTDRDWQTVKTKLATNIGNNISLGKLYKESNSILLNNASNQYVLINTPIDKGEMFTGVLDSGCLVEFVKIKTNWYMGTGSNWDGRVLTLDIK